MRVALAVVIVASAALAACNKADSRDRPAPVAKPTAADTPAITPEAFCDHFLKLANKCKQLADIGIDPQKPLMCTFQAQAALASPQAKQFAKLGACAIANDDCEGFFRCVAGAKPDPTANEQLRACRDTSDGADERAVGIPKDEYARRNGAGVVKLRDAASSPGKPIEMCGVTAANQWLTTLWV